MSQLRTKAKKVRPSAVGLLAAAVGICFGGTPVRASDQPKIFLTSAIKVDLAANTFTLPLYQGFHSGSPVWYIVTDSSDQTDAVLRGVNYAPKLANALGTPAVQTVQQAAGQVIFKGTVDFSPKRDVVPGPTGFPPASASPGSVGDALYTPLISTGNGVVLNAPQVANTSGVHDKVVSIDYSARTVTLRLTPGFYNGKRILYLSTDASDPVVAALEAGTFAPNMNAAPGLASDDVKTSARSGIVPVVNGPTGINNPNRQGLQSALLGEGSPLNVTQHHPENSSGNPPYSPLWDVHPLVWTDAAIAAGQRELLADFSEIANAVQSGLAISGGAGPQNPDIKGLRAAGFIVNCPIVLLE